MNTTFEPGDSGEETLSAAGRARKAAMLLELDAAMRRQNGRRRAVRTGIVVAPVLLMAAAALWTGFLERPVAPSVKGGPVPGIAAGAPREHALRFEIVRTGTASLGFVQRIGDEELQGLLAASGRPSGLIRTGGRVILASDLVAAEPEAPADNDEGERQGVNG
jgi:hypothetical protein